MSDLVARFFLKYSSRLSGLRQFPGLGEVTHRISHRILAPDRRFWIQVQKGAGKGLRLRVYPRTGRTFYEGGAEPALQELLMQRLRPGMVFYDLGANIGFFTLLAARAVGPTGKIFAFEADPELAQYLAEHIERNGVRTARVIRRAVWSSTGTVTFRRADASASPDRGLGRVVSASTPSEDTFAVPCISLDDFVGEEPLPDFIKCDVEGAEVQVFAGARKVLEHRPLVACEVHSDDNRVQLTQLFSSLGYSLNWFTPQHMLAVPA